MRLLALGALVMVAFAANSVLNRAAVGGELIGAMPFALVRVASGAAVLVLLTRAVPGRRHLGPALALAVYLVGFSLAYRGLDAGIGALILFAVVQVTMLAGAALSGEGLPTRRIAGAGVALAGLAALLWPQTGAVPAAGPAALMVAAAVGWGLYSLAGRGAAAPLRDTAANFTLALPVVALAALPFGWDGTQMSGVALAVVSGAVTSGLGYALWYAVLPQIGAGRAAVAQLTVPVLAMAGGALLLAEGLTGAAAAAALVVMAGVALAVLPGSRRGR